MHFGFYFTLVFCYKYCFSIVLPIGEIFSYFYNKIAPFHSLKYQIKLIIFFYYQYHRFGRSTEHWQIELELIFGKINIISFFSG